MLQVRGLCFSYPQRRLFDHWDALLAPGVTLLCGDEGSGKSTLLRLLAGDLTPDAGQLQIGALRLDQQPELYRQCVFRTDPRSSALDQVTPEGWFDTLRESYPMFDRDAPERLLRDLSLQESRHKPMFMLSTGSRRKVWLVGAWASGAAVTLLDQPFAALDKASIGVILDLLQEAACNPTRTWVLADYEPPHGLAPMRTIELG